MSTPPLHERVKSNSTAYVEGFEIHISKSRLKKRHAIVFSTKSRNRGICWKTKVAGQRVEVIIIKLKTDFSPGLL